MSSFDGYTKVSDGLPQADMFVDAVGVRADGIYKQMKLFYRAKPKKEYYKDFKGKLNKRVSGTGFVIPKPHNGFKVIAWKPHVDANKILEALYGRGGAEE